MSEDIQYINKAADPPNERLISWVRILMISAGFWNGPLNTNPTTKKIFYVYSLFMRACTFLFWALLTLELIRLIAGGFETQIVSTSLSVVVTDSKIIAKMLIYLKYNMLNLFGEIVEKEREVWSSGNEEIKSLYRGKIKFIRFAVLAICVSNSLTIGLLDLYGVFDALSIRRYNIMNNASLETHSMYQVLLPFSKMNHIGWYFSTQVLWAWIGLLSNVVTQLIYVTILIYAASQLQVLQIRFRDFVGTELDLNSTDELLKNKTDDLKELIRTHHYIIKFIQQFNERTKYITMMEFLFSSLDLASVSISIIKMDILKTGWLFFFFLLLLTQLFLIGWSCNEIKVQSEEVGSALFQSEWYLLNKEAKQIVYIIIARTRKPLLMNIGLFGPMTTNSIVLVLKAAYSYVNIMR